MKIKSNTAIENSGEKHNKKRKVDWITWRIKTISCSYGWKNAIV